MLVRLFLVSLTALFVFSCATTSSKKETTSAGDLGEDSRDLVNLETARWVERAEHGEASAAMMYFQKFQQQNPQSVYMNRALYGEALSLEKMERYPEALEVYKNLMKSSKARYPKIYAQSLYRSSYIYEANGDDIKLLAALQEASGLEKDLPAEVIQAEIPARRAVIYAKLDQKTESEKYLLEADRGLRRVMEQVQMNPEWLAKIYFQMGKLSLDQMSDQTIASYLKAFQKTQRYLLNSIAQNNSVWSNQSTDSLVSNYNSFFSRIQNFKYVDRPDDLKEKSRQQFYLYADLMKVLNEALLLKPLSEQRSNDYQKKIFGHLETMEEKISKTLMAQFDKMPLTEESSWLNGLQRPGQTLNPQPMPEEKKK